MPLSPGDMWTKVTIQQATKSQNEVGETVLTWSDFATVWASVESLSARETERFAETVGFMTHRIKVRYLSGLTGAMRISYRNRILEIGQIMERDRLWHQEIICTEKRSDG
jgi:SPP1 family predicted phage head-tail adaptor